MKYLVLLGRILYSAIFVMSGPGHLSADTIAYAASKGVPLASVAVLLSGIMALVGGLCILLEIIICSYYGVFFKRVTGQKLLKWGLHMKKQDALVGKDDG